LTAYATSKNIATNCESSARTTVTVKVNPNPLIAITDKDAVYVDFTHTLGYSNTGAVGTVKWTSGDISKATVNQTTGEVKGISPGIVTITCTVTTPEGCIDTDTYDVEVKAKPNVTITNQGDVCTNGSRTLDYVSSVSPVTSVVWTSSNPQVATIDGNGVITGLSAGKTTITCTVMVHGGAGVNECEIVVNPIPRVNSISDITVCRGGAVAEIVFGTDIVDTAVYYVWEADNVWNSVSSGAASGGNTIPAFTAKDDTPNIAHVSTITVTPKIGDCDGVPKTFTVTVIPTPTYSDVRISVCPDPVGTINLSKYLDTFNLIAANSIQWTDRGFGASLITPDGNVTTADLAFSPSRIHTFSYTINSSCAPEQSRRLYLDVLLNGDMIRPMRDTVVMCYLHAEAMHLDQLFGIEANGTFVYPAEVSSFVKCSSGGATIMDGRKIYEDNNISDFTYHNHTAKAIEVTYHSGLDSCLQGRIFTIVIVLTQDIII
jgi:hypothetical protein